jgi:hypothetical protein
MREGRCFVSMMESTMPPKAKKSTMSAEHKSALAQGRRQGAAVRNYLDALEQHRPKRGRKRTKESISNRLKAIEGQLAAASGIDRLHLIQERMDLQTELSTMGAKIDLSRLEAEFVATAKDYGQRKGISYAAWREQGVTPDVLRRAGISRGSR